MICELGLYIKVGQDGNLLESPLCRAAAAAVAKQYLEMTIPTVNIAVRWSRSLLHSTDGGEQGVALTSL